jgi:hypothetical protein
LVAEVPPGGREIPHYDGPGQDHPFVGRTERDISLRYPLVRVVWRDGDEPFVNADGRPGRVSLAVVEGVVVGAEVEGCGTRDDLPACNPSADDGPDLVGEIVEVQEAGGLLVRAERGPYGAGMILTGGGELRDEQGRHLPLGSLSAGDRIHGWLAGGCLEPDPPYCAASILVRLG